MNVTDLNGTQNCCNHFIDMGDVISKDSVNETKEIVEKSIDGNLQGVICTEILKGNLTAVESLSESDVSSGLSTKDASNGCINHKIPVELVESVEEQIKSNKNTDGKCVCNKCYIKSEIVGMEQYQMLQNLWSELHDIVQGLYESKFNDLSIVSHTCCKGEVLSKLSKSGDDLLDLYSETVADSNTDWEDCTSCSTCEATLKECGIKSDCGCFDLTGFPHHNLRELRNSKCIDARVIYLVERLYKKNPHQLFQQLEDQIKTITTNLHNRLEMVMKNHNNEPNLPELYIKLVLEFYEKLCSASKRVTPLLMQLQRGHLARFSLTWELLNKRLYLHCIHVKVQPYVLDYVSQFRKIQSDEKLYRDLVQRYIALDEEMTLISAMWKDVSAMIDDYNSDQKELQERQIELDNRYLALLDIRKHKKQKLQNDLKKLTKELGDLRAAEASKRINKSNSVPTSSDPQQANVPTNSQTNTTQLHKSKNLSNCAVPDIPNRECEYADRCHCCSPELCISEEVIRVLNKETDGAVDGTRITASSTPRGDIVCLPGDGKKTSARPMDSQLILTKESPNALINARSDNPGALQNVDVKRKIIRLPDDFPCPCKVDCKHHNLKTKDKIPIHSPTCKSGLNGITKSASSVPATEAKAEQQTQCPKHGRRKLATNERKLTPSNTNDVNNKEESLENSKPSAHSHGHNCCGGDGDGSHMHWTPSSHNKGCACCYCSVYEGAPPNTSSPVNRKYNEARERLRGKLNKTKALNKNGGTSTDAAHGSEHLEDTESLDSKEKIRRFALDGESRDSSSCLSYEDPRNVKDLLDWIEGAPARVKDPAKKAAKKARQKLKKLEIKEKESPTITATHVGTNELLHVQKQMYVVPEPAKSKASTTASSAPADGMVNIRLLPSDVPRVAVTAVGSSPDKNKLLYTLINGQKIIPEAENTKKKEKKIKNKSKQSLTVDTISSPPVEAFINVNNKSKQNKCSENKSIQYSVNSKTNKTDEKLVKDKTKSEEKKCTRNKEDSKNNDKLKINEKNIKSMKNNIEKTPKCQDKFCQTDDKLNETSDNKVNLSKVDNSKKGNKQNKSKNSSNQQQNTKSGNSILKEIPQNTSKKQKQESQIQTEINKNKLENKVSTTTKSNKNKVADKVTKVTKKADVIPEPVVDKINTKDNSMEWIEINKVSKPRSNNSTKTNVSAPVNVNGNTKTSTKSKKNKNKHDSRSSSTNMLANAFEKLQLNSDTTIEITKDISLKNTTLHKAENKPFVRNEAKSRTLTSTSEYSIMDQLNQGVGVERLKLPPGITLTRVDAATAHANQQRVCQQFQVGNKKNCPPVAVGPQKPAMIIANPVQYSTTSNTNAQPKINSVVGGKSSRKSRRRNKNQVSHSTTANENHDNKQPKMITLRNPLFQNNNLVKMSPADEQYSAQTGPMYNPIPMPKQASITQNKDGMFTIRSPALQHALSTGATNFRPHPYSEIPDTYKPFSYFSNSPPQSQNSSSIGESLYQNATANNNASLFSNSGEASKPICENNIGIPNDHGYQINVHNSDIGSYCHNGISNNSVEQPNLSDVHSHPATEPIHLNDDNMSFFTIPEQGTIHPSNNVQNSGNGHSIIPDHGNSATSNLCNYMNIQNVQRLNSQVTIHNISDSLYVSHSHDYQENGPSVEITKMPTTQQIYGKFGNIGEELTVTRSNLLHNSVDYTHQIQSQFFNGQSVMKCRKDSELVDNIFAPNQMVNLSELESEERDIESFKRFNYYFEPPKNKPKINLNVNDIVVKKKSSGGTDSGAACISFNDYVPNVQQYPLNECLQKKF